MESRVLKDSEVELEELVIEEVTPEIKPKKKYESRMLKTEEVENISLNIEGNILSIQVNLDKEIGTTKRGKTSIATTHGSKYFKLSDDCGCFLSLTVFGS